MLDSYYFSGLIGTIFLEVWKRRNATLAYEWDVDTFEDTEPDRPQFFGTDTRPVSKVFNLIVIYFTRITHGFIKVLKVLSSTVKNKKNFSY